MTPSPARTARQARWSWNVVWLLILAGIAAWVAYRLGAFDLYGTVESPEGSVERFVVTFGAVDHPFHATRADLFRRSLLDGDLLRWISAHQGGYPVEFYPLGAPAFETAVWALLLGSVPMAAAHKIAVIVIFLLPVVGFLLLAQFDGLSLGVGVVALAFHVSVRGWWWSGGYMELVEWGLVSSVLAAAAALIFMPCAIRAVRRRSLRWAGISSVVAAFALSSNLRSIVPLMAIGAGMLVSLVIESDRRVGLRGKGIVAAAIVILTAATAAPLLIPAVRFGDLYYFVSYQQYGAIQDYIDASVQAVSGPIFVLSVIGIIAAFALPRLVAARFVAATLIAYAIMTVLFSGLAGGLVIDQLEPPRLMPFQRLAMVFLAAVGCYAILAAVARLLRASRSVAIEAGLLAVMVGTIALYVILDSSPIADSDRGLYPVPETTADVMVDQQRAVDRADAVAAPGTAVLVIGTNLSWHDQFWSFLWSDRPFFFDDWLWYWQRNHVGDYDPAVSHAYDDDTSAFEPGYLATHGIGAVVVTGPSTIAASSAADLEPSGQFGSYSVFAVRDPVPIVTGESANIVAITVENQRITAETDRPTSTFVVRRNWFPRWSASVDGRPATIIARDDGYMEIQAGSPGTQLEVVYGVDRYDWLGRLLLILGVAGAAAAIVQPQRLEHLLRLEPADDYTHGSIGTTMMVGESRSNAARTSDSSSSGDSARTPGMP